MDQFWPYMGGIQVWAARLLPELVERGFTIVVVTSHCGLELPDQDRYKGVEVFRFSFWESLLSHDAAKIAGVRRQFRDLKASLAPDLVHANLTGPSVYFHAATPDSPRRPMLVSLHDVLRGHGSERDSLFGQVLRGADWVTAGSMLVLDDVRRTVPEITSRSSLVYQGFDAPSLGPTPLPTDPPQVLCIGRLVDGKGIDVAIAAFASVRAQFPRVRLTIASDGPERSSLERQVRALGLAGAVDFLGWIEFDRMPSLLNSASVVVVPSLVPEGFGLVALEAALMARPVVASRSGALPEVVADGETGLVVERGDPRALAAAISTLIANPVTATAMGQAGRRRAQALFGLGRHVDAFDALYRQLAGGDPSGDSPSTDVATAGS